MRKEILKNRIAILEKTMLSLKLIVSGLKNEILEDLYQLQEISKKEHKKLKNR